MFNTQFRSLLTLGPLWCITRHCNRIRDDGCPRNLTLALSLNRRKVPSLSILFLHRSFMATLSDDRNDNVEGQKSMYSQLDARNKKKKDARLSPIYIGTLTAIT